jgi:predicted PurR-regulated permease PerM
VNGPAARRSGIPLTVLVPVLAALAALWLLRTALAPFFVAMVGAYLMEPLTSWLARRMPRWLAAVLALFGFLLAMALFLWALVPPFVTQVERLVGSIPGWRQAVIDRWLPWLQAHPVLLAKLRQAGEGLNPMAFLEGLRIAGIGLLGWILELTTLILVPLIAYYLLVEGPEMTRDLDSLVPQRHREQVRAVVQEINNRMGGYVRGQLGVTLVMALLQGLGFWLVGVPYAWLLGLLAGVSNLVPYSPYITALPLALLFSALGGAGLVHLLVVVLVFEGVQKIEGFYLTPVWVGKASGLHPLEVLLAIFCFGFTFGLVGLIFAVPLMIVAKSLFKVLIANYKASPWFTGADA